MKNWNEILGNQRVRDVLARAVSTKRLHHAYLFTGPVGVGKHTTAHALAASLNCDQRHPQEFTPNCGQCRTCRLTAERQHPDLFFVEPPNRVITIDQIRQLQKACVSAPYEANYRVVLIDECHAMKEEAANALLKTLEEPPDQMILVLITDQPHRLLDTIISRCQRVRFGALDRQEIARVLPEFIDEPVDAAVLEVAAGYGEGSLGRSVDILQSGMLAERADLVRKISQVEANAPRAWLELAEELSDETQDFEYRIDVLTVFFRDMMLTKRAEPTRVVNSDLQELVEEMAQKFSVQAILTTLDALMSARYRLAGHVNKQLLAEDLVDRLRDPDSRALDRPS